MEETKVALVDTIIMDMEITEDTITTTDMDMAVTLDKATETDMAMTDMDTETTMEPM